MIHRSWWEYSISSKISNYFCWRQLKYQLTPLHLFWKHIKNVFPTSVCFNPSTVNFLFLLTENVYRQIEHSSFFLLDHNGKTWIYRLVTGFFDVPLQRKHDSPMEEDDSPTPSRALIRVKTKSQPKK